MENQQKQYRIERGSCCVPGKIMSKLEIQIQKNLWTRLKFNFILFDYYLHLRYDVFCESMEKFEIHRLILFDDVVI